LSEDSALEGAMKPGDSEQSIYFGSDLLTGSEVRWGLTIKGNPHADILPLFISHNVLYDR
jgi:hypothetical protein